jgi:16S rRNA (uracil1498-N3)-methyltransferase
MGSKQTTLRLFVENELRQDAGIILDKSQAHYVVNVMRRNIGDEIALVNGRNGEWQGVIQEVKKSTCLVHVKEKTRPFEEGADIWLLFSPVKKTQNNLIVQKATELGVREIHPVLTMRTNADRLRNDKMQAHIIEAVEQCERVDLPKLHDPEKLDRVLARLEPDRQLLFCHERDGENKISDVLQQLGNTKKWAVLIGPEGGLGSSDIEQLMKISNAKSVGLGSRILRAETAVIAALSVIQSIAGDWK